MLSELVINAEPKTPQGVDFHNSAKLYYFLTLYDLIIADQSIESMDGFVALNVELEEYAKAEGIANAIKDYRDGVMDEAVELAGVAWSFNLDDSLDE